MRMHPVTPDAELLDHVKAMAIAKLYDEGKITALEVGPLCGATVDEVLSRVFRHVPALVVQTPEGRWLHVSSLGGGILQ